MNVHVHVSYYYDTGGGGEQWCREWPGILVFTKKSYPDWLNSSSTVSTVSAKPLNTPEEGINSTNQFSIEETSPCWKSIQYIRDNYRVSNDGKLTLRHSFVLQQLYQIKRRRWSILLSSYVKISVVNLLYWTFWTVFRHIKQNHKVKDDNKVHAVLNSQLCFRMLCNNVLVIFLCVLISVLNSI